MWLNWWNKCLACTQDSIPSTNTERKKKRERKREKKSITANTVNFICDMVCATHIDN